MDQYGRCAAQCSRPAIVRTVGGTARLLVAAALGCLALQHISALGSAADTVGAKYLTNPGTAFLHGADSPAGGTPAKFATTAAATSGRSVRHILVATGLIAVSAIVISSAAARGKRALQWARPAAPRREVGGAWTGAWAGESERKAPVVMERALCDLDISWSSLASSVIPEDSPREFNYPEMEMKRATTLNSASMRRPKGPLAKLGPITTRRTMPRQMAQLSTPCRMVRTQSQPTPTVLVPSRTPTPQRGFTSERPPTQLMPSRGSTPAASPNVPSWRVTNPRPLQGTPASSPNVPSWNLRSPGSLQVPPSKVQLPAAALHPINSQRSSTPVTNQLEPRVSLDHRRVPSGAEGA